MTVELTIILMLACGGVTLLASWREKKKLLGEVPFIPHIYYKYSALIIFLVLATNLFSKLTGIEWQSPFLR
jgi:hypothetical protein